MNHLTNELLSKGFTQAFPSVTSFQKQIKENVTLFVRTDYKVKRSDIIRDVENNKGIVFCNQLSIITTFSNGKASKQNILVKSTKNLLDLIEVCQFNMIN